MKQREEQMDGGKRGKYGEGVHGGRWGKMGGDVGVWLFCSLPTRIDARLSRSIFQAAGNLTPRTVRQPHPSTKLHTYRVPKATTARCRPRRSPYT